MVSLATTIGPKGEAEFILCDVITHHRPDGRPRSRSSMSNFAKGLIEDVFT